MFLLEVIKEFMFTKVAFTSLNGEFSHNCFGNSHSNKFINPFNNHTMF
jgi:hypothetical protein